VDYVFDVPLDAAKLLTGFSYLDEPDQDLTVLAPIRGNGV
jgi:hypothetical protein